MGQPDKTIAPRIQTVRICDYVWEREHGGWSRCDQRASGVTYMLELPGGLRLCAKHAGVLGHHHEWEHFRKEGYAWAAEHPPNVPYPPTVVFDPRPTYGPSSGRVRWVLDQIRSRPPYMDNFVNLVPAGTLAECSVLAHGAIQETTPEDWEAAMNDVAFLTKRLSRAAQEACQDAVVAAVTWHLTTYTGSYQPAHRDLLYVACSGFWGPMRSES